VILGRLLLLLNLLSAPAAQAADELELPRPIPKKWTDALTTIAADPEPDHLAADVHFPTSNEGAALPLA